jgi:hypothetical protein
VPSNPVVSQFPPKLLLEEPLPERLAKRVHVALPLRVTYWDHEYKPCLDTACTYDISPRGARITGLRSIQQVGDILAVERGRNNNKTFCRVIWVGDAKSELRGQVGIRCVETERFLWDAELRDMEEIYDPVLRETGRANHNSALADSNRRRSSRFTVAGMAELQDQKHGIAPAESILKDLSQTGCLISSEDPLQPGTDLKLVLNVANYDLSVKGQVRHIVEGGGMGIEFREIRKGDRQMLHFLLRKLEEQKLEESFDLELQPSAP